MDELSKHDDRLPDCDCRECAIHERNRLRVEVDRLRASLRDANDQAERFDRLWYLRGEALEAVKERDVAGATDPGRPGLLVLPLELRKQIQDAIDQTLPTNTGDQQS